MKTISSDNIETKSEKIGLVNTMLAVSASMLGFCFVVISYLNGSGLHKTTIVDELTVIAMVAFMANCVLSFLALINTRFQTRKFVLFTSYIFLLGMSILFGIVILIALNCTDVPMKK